MIPKSAELFGSNFRRLLLGWFEAHGRAFPWRSEEHVRTGNAGSVVHDPWMILVSEVMLQQTQTSRVVQKLPVFLELFPDAGALAQAGRAELLRAWQGMGYNSRALRLQETARAITEQHGGVFPREPEALRALPGVGPYTVSAILCFAFGEDVPVIDVNIARILSRVFHRCYARFQVMPEKDLYELAAFLVPEGDAYRYHQALMDLGATICVRRSPRCGSCLLSEICLSAGFLDAGELFDPASARSSEPMFLGEPRRLWRGRIVEVLRSEEQGAVVKEIYEKVRAGRDLPDQNVSTEQDFLKIVDGLLRDGLIERPGQVREGGADGADIIRLPHD